MLRVACLFLVLPVSTTLLADIPQSDYDNCQKLTDSLKRLRCYDNLQPGETQRKSVLSKVTVPVIPVPLSAPEVPVLSSPSLANKPVSVVSENQHEVLGSLSMGRWQVTKKILNAAGELKNTATATLLANSNRINMELSPMLTVHCNGTKTKTFINWGERISKIKQVEILIGGEKFHSKRWNLSRNKEISFYPIPSPYFLKQMSKKNKFEVNLLLKNGETKSASFNTAGMTQAIEPVRAACGW